MRVLRSLSVRYHTSSREYNNHTMYPSVTTLFLVTLLTCTLALIDMRCESDRTCTSSKLMDSQIPEMLDMRLQNVSILTIADSTLKNLDVSILSNISHQLILHQSQIDKLSVSINSTIEMLSIIETRVFHLEYSSNDNLRQLTVEHGRVDFILSSLSFMAELETISIRFLQLGAIDFDIFSKMSKLWLLHLSNNHIENLSSSNNSHCFKKLREVDLCYNNLARIDLSLFDGMVSLIKLNLQFNRLEQLEGSLQTTSLIELDLSGNRLSSVDCCGWNTTAMIKLDLSYNRLEELPDCMQLWHQLTYIQLDHNRLVRIDFAPFESTSLIFLNLKFNAISEMSNVNKLPRETILLLDGNAVASNYTPCYDFFKD